MELIRGLHNLRAAHRGCVLTIGNYDGLHRGHRMVIEQLEAAGRELGLPTVLMTFEPQPQEVFARSAAPARLTRLREKVHACRGAPLERMLVARFDRRFAAVPAREFIDGVLVRALGARFVVVGDDFRFGHKAQGDFDLLSAAGESAGFRVRRTESFIVDGRRVSSGWVREALAAGDFALAERLLGRPYSMCGRVARGDRLGRSIGFATANVPLYRRESPLSGVFAVRVHGLGEEALPGMANIGSRPTVGGTVRRLEVHLFDFDADLYGRHLEVAFVRRLRGEEKFASLDALRRQLGRDEEQAREILEV